jgi:mono/diheme cytochrome c family protein
MRALTWLPLALSLPLLAQAPKDLRLYFQQNCVRCHGADGSAHDSAGKKLKGQDFTDSTWSARTKDGEMVKVILKGKFFGLAMPAFKSELSPQEAQAMVSDVVRKAAKGQVIAPAK